MYSGSGFSEWEIGDLTVIIHNGIYHLFHLIIPNHDYIAHATSKDGISWRRVENALFVGHPGEWDDDMLWTMDVCEVKGKFEMYYTGLQRKDRGVVSRIGLAESNDLISWSKKNRNNFPIEPKGVYYEAYNANPRKWLSFRDPFRFEYKDEVYLLVCARTIHGPVNRRGCVGLVKITNYDVERLPPLLHPMMYDDVECPCVFELKNRFYLIGSIREDVKVRYWFAPDFFGEYHSFHEDTLLPHGNYAARVVKDGDHILVFNFFYCGKVDVLRVLPPPKEVDTDDRGRLFLRTYYRWEKMTIRSIKQQDFEILPHLLSNPTAQSQVEVDKWTCGARSGYEIFCLQRPSQSFIWEGTLTVEGMGKLGLVSDIDNEGSGYFISLDISNGLVQIRSWGFDPSNNRKNFIFHNIQSNTFAVSEKKSLNFKLIRYGRYIELSINDIVELTLIDLSYSEGNIGLYSASSVVSLHASVLHVLPDPEDEYANIAESVTPSSDIRQSD
jgi:beta-fructofuranosidase